MSGRLRWREDQQRHPVRRHRPVPVGARRRARRVPPPILHQNFSAVGEAELRVLRRSVATNVLNPHPWLFWIALGTPTTLRAWESGLPVAIGFVATFFAGLVGVKMCLALFLGRMRAWFASKAYRAVMVILGVALGGMAVWLAMDGASRLGV